MSKNPIEERERLLVELDELAKKWRKLTEELAKLEPWPDPLPGPMVRQIRDALGLTQREIAAACGLENATTISGYERRVHPCTGPTRRCLIMLFERFNSEVTRYAR